MEREVEKRRSSILKFRNPVENAQETQNIQKRRVSFSEKKFVKEFDASLNTMQNSTYEEIAKEFECRSSGEKVEVTIGTLETVVSTTPLLPHIDKDKENILPTIISSQSFKQQASQRNLEMTVLNCNTMELTQFIPSNVQNLQYNQTMLVKENIVPVNYSETMEFTHVVAPTNKSLISNQAPKGDTMNLTTFLPVNNKTYRRSILNPETMDLTYSIRDGALINTNNIKHNTMFGDKMIRDTMDLTTLVHRHNVQSNCNYNEEDVEHDRSSIDMDLTVPHENCIEQISTTNHNLIGGGCIGPTDSTKDKDIVFNDEFKDFPNTENTENEFLHFSRNSRIVNNEVNTTGIHKEKEMLTEVCETQNIDESMDISYPDVGLPLNCIETEKFPTSAHSEEVRVPLRVYDCGKSITEQLQNKEKSFHDSSKKNSLINFMTTNYSADDTQYLINVSVSGNKNLKSDFSRLLSGDLNPSFLSSKFLPLSDFGSDAFSNINLENSKESNIRSLCNQKDMEGIKLLSMIKENSQKLPFNQINDESVPVAASNLKRLNVGSLEHLKEPEAKIPKMEESLGKNRLSNVTDTIMSEIINKSETKNISDESILSLCNNSFEEIPAEVLINDIKHETDVKNKEKVQVNGSVCDDLPNNDEIKENDSIELPKEDKTKIVIDFSIFEHLHNQLLNEINKNRITLEEEMKKLEQLQENLEKRSADNEDIFTKACYLLDRNFEVNFEKLKLEDDEDEENISNSDVQNSDAEINKSITSLSEIKNICEKILTIKERIQQLQKTCQDNWVLVSSTRGQYVFETLYHSVVLETNVDEINGIVKNLQVQSKLKKEESFPQELFIRNEFIKRMDSKIITAAVGEKYDIITLLDYVQMEMIQISQMKRYFSDLSRIGFEMDDNFRVMLKIPSLILRSVWVVSLNMSDIDNIDRSCVSISAQVGSVDEEKIKSMLEPCPKGFAFLKHFVVKVLNYLKTLENRKKK